MMVRQEKTKTVRLHNDALHLTRKDIELHSLRF